MKTHFPPNGSWPRELDDFAARIERVQKGYAQWMQKQVKGKDHVGTRSRKIGWLRDALLRIVWLLMGR